MATIYKQIGNHTFKTVGSIKEVPLGHLIWNIGRHNFPLDKHIPMCRYANPNTDDFSIDPNDLYAVPCESEEQALALMDKAIKTGDIYTTDLILLGMK